MTKWQCILLPLILCSQVRANVGDFSYHAPVPIVSNEKDRLKYSQQFHSAARAKRPFLQWRTEENVTASLVNCNPTEHSSKIKTITHFFFEDLQARHDIQRSNRNGEKSSGKYGIPYQGSENLLQISCALVLLF